jgi:DNA polymerase-3 subunit beta
MKIKVDKSEFEKAITPIMGAVSGRNNTIPAVEGILLTTKGDDAVTLTTFDIEKGYRITIEAKVLEPGSYIINGSRLNNIVRAMPSGELTVYVDNKMTVKISGGRSEFELSAMDGADFPTLPEFKSEMKFTVNQGTLNDMISRVKFSIAQSDERKALSGAYFVFGEDDLKIVACDGNRLAVREQKCKVTSVTDKKPDISFILPGKTIEELSKILRKDDEDVTITVTRRNCVFECGGLLFFSRLIEGNYLEYNKFIPQSSKYVVEIETEKFIESLGRAFLVTEDKALGQTKSFVKCNFNDDALMISSVSVNGRVYDEISIEGMEGELEIGFSCKYLLEALRACGCEKVVCELNTPYTCMVIKPAVKNEAESFLYLVLPVRMKG